MQHPFHMDEKQKKAVEEFVEESQAKALSETRNHHKPLLSSLYQKPMDIYALYKTTDT